MKKHGKKFTAARAQIAADRTYTIEQAIPLVQKVKFAKFDETIEVSLRLGVDPKHADQMVRGAVVLPHGIGKTVRVAVFAKGDKERESREAGADVIGARCLRLLLLLALREDQDAHGLAGAVREHEAAAHHLVGVLRIDAKAQ